MNRSEIVDKVWDLINTKVVNYKGNPFDGVDMPKNLNVPEKAALAKRRLRAKPVIIPLITKKELEELIYGKN